MFHWLLSLLFPGIFVRKPFFLISDLHFNHVKIISLANRPFPDVQVMNQVLIRNWNNAVTKRDHVWCLGDFTAHRNVGYWIRRLNGRILFVKGNHDRYLITPTRRKLIRYGGFWFLLIHNPKDTPFWWRFFEKRSWVVHGHTHNSEHYPFINGRRRQINVSVERIGYRPLSIDQIISLRLESIWKMETIHSGIIPRYRSRIR
jgi:calcineurin-like phosphoesterase family protein